MKCTCIRCGKEFEAKHKTAVCSDCHTAVCVVCGKTFDLQTPWTQKTCSPKCRGIYRKQSGISAQVANKARETLIKRYGVTSPHSLHVFHRTCKYCGKPFDTTDGRQIYCKETHYGPCPVCGNLVEIKEMYLGPQACSEECRQARIQETCLSKYGSTTSVNSVHGREKAKATLLEKYGVDHYSKTPEYRQKYMNTMQERYGVDYPLQCEEIREKLQQTCETKYGVAFNCMRPECRSSYRTISKINQQFSERLNQSNIDHTLEFSLGRYSFDFKIGNVLVEIDPSITHNTYLSIFPDVKPTVFDYHLKKTQLAAENGYRCIHVFDWDDWDKVIDLVRQRDKIGARQCEVVKLDTKTAELFTGRYHLAGSCRGQTECYGLVNDSQLLEVMTFGIPRYNKKYDWEILRLCSLQGITVIGGASKLFNAFVKEHRSDKLQSIISYCDKSKFTGSVYQQMGMKKLSDTAPNQIWSKDNKKITQNLLNQRGFDQLFGTTFGKGTSNEELMLKHGWLPVYDCGQFVFEYTF